VSGPALTGVRLHEAPGAPDPLRDRGQAEDPRFRARGMLLPHSCRAAAAGVV
jgi:hypothetical protein